MSAAWRGGAGPKLTPPPRVPSPTPNSPPPAPSRRNRRAGAVAPQGVSRRVPAAAGHLHGHHAGEPLAGGCCAAPRRQPGLNARSPPGCMVTPLVTPLDPPPPTAALCTAHTPPSCLLITPTQPPTTKSLRLTALLAPLQYELEAGVAIGIVLCLLYFAFTYARVNMTVGDAGGKRESGKEGARRDRGGGEGGGGRRRREQAACTAALAPSFPYEAAPQSPLPLPYPARPCAPTPEPRPPRPLPPSPPPRAPAPPRHSPWCPRAASRCARPTSAPPSQRLRAARSPSGSAATCSSAAPCCSPSG